MAKKSEVTGWAGWVGFASFMMMLGGFFGVLVGLTAIIRDQFFVITQNNLFVVNIKTWGWVHLILSVIIICAGYAVLNGRVWARTIGVILAFLSALANMLFIPYYPIWSLLIIAVNVAVIYALIVHGGELAE